MGFYREYIVVPEKIGSYYLGPRFEKPTNGTSVPKVDTD